MKILLIFGLLSISQLGSLQPSASASEPVTQQAAEEAPEVFEAFSEAVLADMEARYLSAKRLSNELTYRINRYYNYKDADVLSNRIDRILDRIERDLLPVAPEKAVEALGRFIELDCTVFEHADDSFGTFGACFNRAVELMVTASIAAGRTDCCERWFLRLVKCNDYGARDLIFERAACFLPEARLDAVIEEWTQKLREFLSETEFDYKHRTLERELQQMVMSRDSQPR